HRAEGDQEVAPQQMAAPVPPRAPQRAAEDDERARPGADAGQHLRDRSEHGAPLGQPVRRDRVGERSDGQHTGGEGGAQADAGGEAPGPFGGQQIDRAQRQQGDVGDGAGEVEDPEGDVVPPERRPGGQRAGGQGERGPMTVEGDGDVHAPARDEALEAVLWTAAEVLDVSAAAVGLVDDDWAWRQASVGLDLGDPRQRSFCQRVVAEGAVLVVPDAHEDPLMAKGAGAPDPALRMWAGTPLVTADGQPLGALLVADRRPRELTGTEQATLDALAQ